MKYYIILFFLNSNVLLFGQQITGTVLEMNSETPIEFVNIGVVGKNVGTVSDQNGKYFLKIVPEYNDDSLRFSCIGYRSYTVKISDFINLNNGNVILEKMVYQLSEVVVRPKKVKQKTLGITSGSKMAVACFIDSISGGEIGILMKNKQTAFLKEVNLNIHSCSYDTIFYRLNIYKALDSMQFENILRNPVYFSSTKDVIKKKITVDLRQHNLVIDGDFLVTFEFVKNLGKGSLCFPANLLRKSYVKKASQGTWNTGIGIPISALVDIEK